MSEGKRNIKLSETVTSALLSSFSSSVILQPCDFVKTRLQVDSLTRTSVRSPSNALSTRPVGLIQLVSTAVKKNGVFVLWRGTVPSVCRVVPGVTLYFTTLEALQSFAVPENRSPTAIEAAVIAFTSRCFSALCLVPMTVVKTHFESGMHENASVIRTFRTVYKKSGIRGLYSGMGPTLARDAPFSSSYYMFYSSMKTRLTEFRGSPVLTPVDLFFCAAISSCFASFLTQPADVLKTRRQMFPWIRISYRFIVKDIYEHEGIRGLFRGILPRLLRRSGMAALSWTLFDTLKQSI